MILMEARVRPSCIFCGFNFQMDDGKRSREHIIPEFLAGSLVIRDVCVSCNSKLGAEVDHLVVQDSRIINAINSLDLPDLQARIREEGHSFGIDILDGRKIPAKFHNGKPKLTPRRIDTDGIECPEEEALAALHTIVNRDDRLDWSEEKRKDYVDSIAWPKYLATDAGESCNFPEIGRELRKRQVGEFVTNPKWSPGAAHRLVAKIIFEICHYALDWPLRQLVREDLNWYGAFAYGEKQEEEGRICYRIQDELPPTDYCHLIQILFYEPFIAIDVDFFQSVNFRGCLFPRGQYSLPKHNGNEIEGIGIAMTFKPRPREQFIAFRHKGTGKWQEFQLSERL